MKTQHFSGFINSNALRNENTSIRRLYRWRFRLTAEMTSRIRLIRSGDRYTTCRSISHDRVRSFLPFGNAKCRRMQLREVHTVAWRTSISPRRVCHNVYKSIVAHTERKKENPFAGRTTRQCTTHFSLPHHRRRMANEQINCTEHVERRWRNDEDEIANQKGALKVVDALVAHSNAVVARKDSPETL